MQTPIYPLDVLPYRVIERDVDSINDVCIPLSGKIDFTIGSEPAEITLR